MCGICGIIEFEQLLQDQALIGQMMQSIKHRGPDGHGYFTEDNVALGHVRLSIIDLSDEAGQPMFSDDEKLVIVFNGEIYNYKHLKKELSAKHRFKTRSDTEVLLHAYEEWGEDCLHRLNGMFSFVLFDRERKTLFVVRDRFGIKPLYYYLGKDYFVFASEIKAILASKKIKAALHEQMLYDFIVFNRTDHSSQTCFKHISNLRPGHKMVLHTQTAAWRIEQWYCLPEIHEQDARIDDFTQELLEKLHESVRLHLMSDVPVGAALSGGLDSSTLVTLMRQHLPSDVKLQTFSAVYNKNWEKDEQRYVEILSQRLDIDTTYTRPTAESLLNDLDKLIYQQEEPFGSASLYASWCVYKTANRNHIKVLLNGQGSDEIFAYDYMAAFYFQELFLRVRWLTLLSELWNFYRKQAYPIFTFKLFVFLLVPGWLKNRLITIADSAVNKRFFEMYKDQSHFHKAFFASKTLNHNVKNHLLMKLHHLLRVEDKNSMMFSVEGRIPFLEYQLVEMALQVPAKYKVHQGEVKYILKQSMKSLLPEAIYRRNNKIGYETPMDQWFREDCLKNDLDAVLADDNQPMAPYLNIEYIRQKWQQHLNGKHNYGRVLWKYYYLTKWYKRFFEE